ncbi:uncharacterized protein FIBRA_04396 [Fibroporia radiculosa]|uniref:Peptidase M16 N-terminal domain-containing protein n=1 Tax=Fibroporia radiculosa TaxID=599839 RepID=J4IA52_9APHY|nr:uncharacterized protein FIBRA_04396 [Fibroporia radiculosa]CCM02306.1 predicted protein [Fibroporia radiculosa]
MNDKEWTQIPSEGDRPSFSLFTGPLRKPDLDDRDYRLIELQNGLRAILVHDIAADKAAACMTTQVGSMHDPGDAQGLAHFCEHMITKGSQAFPDENAYLSYVTSNGGVCNAATAPSFANYWFSIGSSFLSGALARSAAFFQSPLFTESLTKREIYAVDSEFKRNVQKDERRILQINRTLSLHTHPYSQFGTGNVESITESATRLGLDRKSSETSAGVDSKDEVVWKATRERLVEWWRTQYCASRLTLAVVGKDSLDDLTDTVVSLYTPILNRGLDPRPVFTQPVWGPSELGSIIFIKTIKDYYGLTVSFLLPDQRPHYKSQPARIIAHFLGHEGPGSVCAFLKRKGWLVSLSAGIRSRNPSVQHFQLTSKLTKEGYENYQDVLLAIYNYFSLLRSSPIDEYHFSEISNMSETHFRFQEKTQPHTYTNWLSYQLSEPYPLQEILSGAQLVTEWDEDLVRELLGNMVPENVRVTLEARDHEERFVGLDTMWLTEKWHGGQYCVRRLDAALIEKAHQGNQNVELFLPEPNPYIPTDLAIDKIFVAEAEKAPTCIRRTALSTLWHKKDDQFWVPKASVRIDIRSPLAYGTPRQAVLTRLLADLVEDALSEVTYAAELAGLAYSLSNHRKGLLIAVGGYSDKLPALLHTILSKLKHLVIDSERLRVISEQASVRRGYENFYLGQPSSLSEEFATWSITPTVWTPADKLAELPYISVEDVERHRDELLSRVYVESLVNGNITKDKAISLIETAEQCIQARPLTWNERPRDRSLSLPEGSNVVWQKAHTNQQEGNSSLSYYCQFGDIAAGYSRLRPVLELIGHMIREPTYTHLRTREQLGYVVTSSVWRVASSMGLSIKIQSMRTPWDVESRVDAFLNDFRDILAKMPVKELEDNKEGLIVKKLEKLKNLSEETGRFWGHISKGSYDFLQHERDAGIIRTLALQEIIDAFDKFVRPSSAVRKKISVHLVSQKVESQPSMDAQHTLVVDSDDPDLAIFKAGLACYPPMMPIVMTTALSAVERCHL